MQVIQRLPFTGSGMTTGYVHNFDAVCTSSATASSSPVSPQLSIAVNVL